MEQAETQCNSAVLLVKRLKTDYHRYKGDRRGPLLRREIQGVVVDFLFNLVILENDFISLAKTLEDEQRRVEIVFVKYGDQITRLRYEARNFLSKSAINKGLKERMEHWRGVEPAGVLDLALLHKRKREDLEAEEFGFGKNVKGQCVYCLSEIENHQIAVKCTCAEGLFHKSCFEQAEDDRCGICRKKIYGRLKNVLV